MKQCVCKICGHDETKCSFDENYRRAIELANFKSHISTALLQRELKMSYEKTLDVIEKMESEGLISPADGAKPREIHKAKIKEWIENYYG
jgi:S-DNA-T family DNA segregation ATPase FtsK/SpoIIIE